MKIKNYIILASLAIGFVGCNDDKFSVEIPFPGDYQEEDPSDSPEAPAASYDEQFRPQIHFTPERNWINDPNGMVFADGVWHLYYQYNPQGNGWGNMSWGHATSTDLIHWTEQPVAMIKNEWGDIFSGSCVVDKNNTSGLGAGTIIAFYTASGEHQQQCMAYSVDGGKTFEQYEGNPVISNTDLPDFRDPKVFWHEESGQWIMCLAMGWSHQIEFWGSTNLKNWSKLSAFSSDNDRVNQGQWECPDLIKLPYNGTDKWVLIVSNNPGGPVGGSGTEYFIGSFDGTTFTADNLSYPLWLDYGSDNYAGVTWSNSPDGRVIMIGWMNNWNYADRVPCDPWRSAMTLPRVLSLKEVDGNPVLSTVVVEEIDKVAGNWQDVPEGICSGGDAYEVKVTVSANQNSSFRIANGKGEYMEINVNPDSRRISAGRSSSTGITDFHPLFSLPGIVAPLNESDDEIVLDIFIDRSSVEIFNEEGTMAITNLVFPSEIYDRIEGVENVRYRAISSIWK